MSVEPAPESFEVPTPPTAREALERLDFRLNQPLDTLTTDLRMDLNGVVSALFQLGTTLDDKMDSDLAHWCSRVIQQKVAFIDSVSTQCRAAIREALEAVA